jgi:hypothetical protein
VVDIDDSVSDLIENPLGQFHGSSLDWNSPARLITAVTTRRMDVLDRSR